MNRTSPVGLANGVAGTMCVGDCIVAGVIACPTEALDCEPAVKAAAAIAAASTAKIVSRAHLFGVFRKTLSPFIALYGAAASGSPHVTDASCATFGQFASKNRRSSATGPTLQGIRVLLAALALALPATAAGGSNWATAVVSPGTVAHRATLTLKLHFEMTCGKPGSGPLTIQLPAKMQALPSLAVRIGTTPTTATVSGNQVTLQLPRSHGVTCMSIAPGTLTLYLAGVRNPANAGTYFVHAHLRSMAFTAQLAVRA